MTAQMPAPPSPVATSSALVDVGKVPTTQSLLAFFALAFAWTWTWGLLGVALKVDWPIAATALSMLSGFGPSLAAVVVVFYSTGRAGLGRWLTRRLQWRKGWRWVLLAFAFPAVYTGLAAIAHMALGGTLPPSPYAGHVWLAALNVLLIFLVGGPLGEEFGWRGFALPALQARWGWRVASVVLGGIWAVWHLPLFYSAGNLQSQWPFGWFALSVVASSVLFAWLFNRSQGSLVPVLVLHTAVNAWLMIVPVRMLPDGSNLRLTQFVVGILVLTSVALLIGGERSQHKVVEPA
jgi:hypothetical protein